MAGSSRTPALAGLVVCGEPDPKGIVMTVRKNEIAARRQNFRQGETECHRDKVLTFAQWCAINNFSKTTGHRLVKRGEGPSILQLSPRRIGIRESDNRVWQASRAR
jgi:predicted DNA-binding transcriptional regulator AlpA